MTASNETIQRHLLKLIDHSTTKITPLQLEKILSQELNSTRHRIHRVIKDLVSQGIIAYTNMFGQTYIERSFHTPNRLSQYVIIKPPGIDLSAASDDVVVTIQSGAAFGNGSHPSTRLSVKGLEYTLRKTTFLKSHEKTRMLDIGAGSGILSMVALKMGVRCATGVDIDPCSQFESKQNARLNDLTEQYTIQNRLLEDIQDTFHIITANLRFPTLMRICSKIDSMSPPKGMVILAGIKTEESTRLAEMYQNKEFDCVWRNEENRWEGMVFMKK